METPEFSGSVTFIVGKECLATNADSLTKELTMLLSGPHEAVFLDLSKTQYIDAAGIGVLAAAVFEARRKGRVLRAFGATGTVLDILTQTGVDRQLKLNPV